MKKLLLETKISKMYILGIILIIVLLLASYYSYAVFAVTKEKSNAISIITGTLSYNIKINNIDTNQITIDANSMQTYEVEISNINSIEAKFLFYYYTLPMGVDISYKEETGYSVPSSKGNVIDSINSGNGSESYYIEIRNVTDESKIIELGVKVGLSWNELNLDEGENPFGLRNETVYDYTGNIQQYNVPVSGIYTLETWGAQGGSVEGYSGGLGGYSFLQTYLEAGQTLYIVVGGAGEGATEKGENLEGGFNGGGSIVGSSSVNHLLASGGGATHIALQDGLLSSLENDKDSILIVSGGGGGGQDQPNHNEYAAGARWGRGGSGGGIYGGGPFSNYGENLDGENLIEITAVISTQETGFAFGQGQDGSICWRSSGGGGYYGGYNGCGHGSLGQELSTGSGYGGSGYIKENGYMKNGVKEGNGYAKITQFLVAE